MHAFFADLELNQCDEADKDQQNNTGCTGLTRFSITIGEIVDVVDQCVGRIDWATAGHNADAIKNLERGNCRNYRCKKDCRKRKGR